MTCETAKHKKKYGDLSLIVCDNDGCLMGEEPGPIEFEAMKPIAEYNRRAVSSGGKLPPLTIATGRPAPFVELLMRFLQCDPKIPAICEHGVFTYSLSENFARLEANITKTDMAALDALGEWLSIAHPDWVREAGKSGTISIYVPEGGAEVDRCRELIASKVEAEGWPMVVGRTVTYVNVTLGHVTKATALTRVLGELEIEPKRVLAIGDTAGDLVMAEMCGWFACPSNAAEEVRARSDYVSRFAVTEGVLDILGEFTGGDCEEEASRHRGE